MDIYEAIAARKTIRDFQDKPVEYEVIERIVGAGLNAPSHDHMRNWEFIVVNDLETRKALVKPITPRSSEEAVAIVDRWGMEDAVQREMYIDGIPKQVRMILTAGALIIPCFHQPEPLLEPATLSSLNGFASIWCCIENILVAAASEGVFGVTRIPFVEERANIKTVLNIPSDYEVPCYLALGYPELGAKRAKQHEVRVEGKISFDRWGSKHIAVD